MASGVVHLDEQAAVFADLHARMDAETSLSKSPALLGWPQLRGDWSRPSAAIGRFLTTRGSAAVPFNQIYGPGLAQGRVLSPLLSRDELLATLSDAKGQ